MVARKPPEGTIDRGAELEDEPTVEFVLAEEKPILSEDEITVLRDKAKKKVQDDIKKRAANEMLARFEHEERQAAGLEAPDVPDEWVEVKINLAPFTDRIMLDSKIFLHGHTYTVQRRVAMVLNEQCARSWAHEREIKGEKMDADLYRAQGATISPSLAKIGNRVVSLH